MTIFYHIVKDLSIELFNKNAKLSVDAGNAPPDRTAPLSVYTPSVFEKFAKTQKIALFFEKPSCILRCFGV